MPKVEIYYQNWKFNANYQTVHNEQKKLKKSEDFKPKSYP